MATEPGKLFKQGDLVELKSGGPAMTIKEFSTYSGTYSAQWFAGKKLEVGSFTEASLQVATKPTAATP